MCFAKISLAISLAGMLLAKLIASDILAISLAGMLLAAPVRTAATQVQQPAEATAPAAAAAYQQSVETAPVCPREDCPRADCPYAPGT